MPEICPHCGKEVATLEEMAQARGGIVKTPILFGDFGQDEKEASIGNMTVKIPSEEIDAVVKKIRIRKK